MSDSDASTALTDLLEEAAREVSFRAPAMGGLAARLRDAGAAIARQSLPPGLDALRDVRDELQLIESVLRFYPVSIARDDALRAACKLLRIFQEKEMLTETKDPLAFDAEFVLRALVASGGVRDAVFQALARLKTAALSSQPPAPSPWAFIEMVSKQKPEKPDYWSSCGQCQSNSNEADELLKALPSAPSTEGAAG